MDDKREVFDICANVWWRLDGTVEWRDDGTEKCLYLVRECKEKTSKMRKRQKRMAWVVKEERKGKNTEEWNIELAVWIWEAAYS